MWIPSYHAFPSRAAFLAACDAAGWPRGPDGKPMPPDGAAVQEIGPIMAPSTVGADGSPVPGDVLDARYHVNAAWHGMEPLEVFRAVAVAPGTPSRAFALPAPQPPVEPPVPSVIPAWKGKAALREAGLLDEVEAAVAAAGGGASSGRLDRSVGVEPQIHALAGEHGLTQADVDQMFQEAATIQS